MHLSAQDFLPHLALDEWEQLNSSTGFTVYQTEDLLFGMASCAIAGELSQGVEAIYKDALDLLKAEGKTDFWRFWHFIPGINEDDDGEERYKRFCSGRHRALIESGFLHPKQLPAATAVGTDGDAYVMAFLASNRPGQSVENPNQVEAYNYPEQFGAHAPLFSRAYLADNILYVSGTASISGHESRHSEDLAMQLIETKQRLDELTQARQPKHMIAYVRDAEDMDIVSRFIKTHFKSLGSCRILKADICRRELLVEIELIAQ